MRGVRAPPTSRSSRFSVTDHLLFAAFEDAFLGGLFEEQANLLGSDGGLLRASDAKQSQNAVRGGAEQDDNRAADAGEELHRSGNQGCDSFRGVSASRFGTSSPRIKDT